MSKVALPEVPPRPAIAGMNRTGPPANRVVAALAALALAWVALISGATAANASSYGCTGYGTGISWQGVYIKNGTFCGAVNGSGNYVNYVGGNFYTHVALNSICNFSLKADFYDVNGNWYTWATTGVSYRCSLASDLANIPIYSNMRSGSVRVSLMSNGGTVAAVWESIHP